MDSSSNNQANTNLTSHQILLTAKTVVDCLSNYIPTEYGYIILDPIAQYGFPPNWPEALKFLVEAGLARQMRFARYSIVRLLPLELCNYEPGASSTTKPAQSKCPVG